MKFGFIPINVLPTAEWYIINESGKILDKGGPGKKNLNIFKISDTLPSYWIKNCCRWYNSIEELCEKQLTELLY